MNKSELVKVLAEKSKISIEDAEMVVQSLLSGMKEALVSGGRVEIRGFGSFKVKHYEGYQGRNPKTGEFIDVPPKTMPFFRAGKELRKFLNQ
jgi:integration host factor subunit beta